MIATGYQTAIQHMSDERLTLEHDNISEALRFATRIHERTNSAASEIDVERLIWKLDDIMREQHRRRI